MAGKKTLYLDLETTGLYPDEGAAILSIGAVLDRNTKKDPIKEFYAVIRLADEEWKQASPQALRVNGFTYDKMVEEGKPFNVVRDEFISFLMDNGVQARKAICLGQNPAFDMEFLQYYMGGELQFSFFPTDDVYDLRDYYSILANRRTVMLVRNRSLKEIALALGVTPEPEPHNALAGARMVKECFEKMVELGVLETYENASYGFSVSTDVEE